MFKATKTNTSKSNSRNIAQHLTNRYSYIRIRVTEGQKRKVMKSEETIQGPRGLVPGGHESDILLCVPGNYELCWRFRQHKLRKDLSDKPIQAGISKVEDQK